MKHFLLFSILLATPLFGQGGKSAGINGEGITTLQNKNNFLDALGGTTAGKNLFRAVTPGANSYPRVAADGALTWRTATEVKVDLGLNNVDNTSDANKPVSTATQTALNGKQATLVSGSNIKTVDGQSLLGSGNVATSAGANSPFLVTIYGADPTGVADSSAAVASTFTAASTGNRWVHFPRGVYKFNYTLTFAMASGHWRITGDGGGMTGDWNAVEPAGASLLRPNNNANPVFTFEFLRGVSMSNLEIRGNGAGVSANGILIDSPGGNFAGNGLYIHNTTIRSFTNGLNSVGGCNVVVRESLISNNNIAIKIANLPLAHSYRFEQCSLGGLATILGGSGSSRILQVEDGSFVDLLGCEMGNCTDMVFMAATGAPVVNVIGGNMETMSATVLNTVMGGTFNMSGVRIGTLNKTVVRGDGTTAAITGINIENNQAQGPMTMYDFNGFPFARLAGNGLNNKLVSKYNSDFTSLIGSSVCEKLKMSGRITADQPMVATTTNVVNFPVKVFDIGNKFNTTTGEYIPGKQTAFRISANLRLSGLSTNSLLQVFVNGSSRALLGQAVTSGGVTTVNGTALISVDAGDVVTLRLNTGAGGNTVQAIDNFTSTMSIEEVDYFN